MLYRIQFKTTEALDAFVTANAENCTVVKRPTDSPVGVLSFPTLTKEEVEEHFNTDPDVVQFGALPDNWAETETPAAPPEGVATAPQSEETVPVAVQPPAEPAASPVVVEPVAAPVVVPPAAPVLERTTTLTPPAAVVVAEEIVLRNPTNPKRYISRSGDKWLVVAPTLDQREIPVDTARSMLVEWGMAYAAAEQLTGVPSA